MVLGIWSRPGETVIDKAGSAGDRSPASGSGEQEDASRARTGSGSSVSSTSRGGSQGRMGGCDLARPGSSAGRKVDSCLATAGTELLLVISLFRVEKAELELTKDSCGGPEDVWEGLIISAACFYVKLFIYLQTFSEAQFGADRPECCQTYFQRTSVTFARMAYLKASDNHFCFLTSKEKVLPT